MHSKILIALFRAAADPEFQILFLNCILWCSVVESGDPSFQVNPDQEPSFQVNPDPDPSFQVNPDPGWPKIRKNTAENFYIYFFELQATGLTLKKEHPEI